MSGMVPTVPFTSWTFKAGYSPSLEHRYLSPKSLFAAWENRTYIQQFGDLGNETGSFHRPCHLKCTKWLVLVSSWSVFPKHPRFPFDLLAGWALELEALPACLAATHINVVSFRYSPFPDRWGQCLNSASINLHYVLWVWTSSAFVLSCSMNFPSMTLR